MTAWNCQVHWYNQSIKYAQIKYSWQCEHVKFINTINHSVTYRIANELSGDILIGVEDRGCRQIVHDPVVMILSWDWGLDCIHNIIITIIIIIILSSPVRHIVTIYLRGSIRYIQSIHSETPSKWWQHWYDDKYLECLYIILLQFNLT